MGAGSVEGERERPVTPTGLHPSPAGRPESARKTPMGATAVAQNAVSDAVEIFRSSR